MQQVHVASQSDLSAPMKLQLPNKNGIRVEENSGPGELQVVIHRDMNLLSGSRDVASPSGACNERRCKAMEILKL